MLQFLFQSQISRPSWFEFTTAILRVVHIIFYHFIVCSRLCIRLLLFYSVIFQSVIFQSCKFQSCKFSYPILNRTGISVKPPLMQWRHWRVAGRGRGRTEDFFDVCSTALSITSIQSRYDVVIVSAVMPVIQIGMGAHRIFKGRAHS